MDPKTGGPSARVCCLLSFEGGKGVRSTENEKARSHLTMGHFPTCRRTEHKKARSHLTMVYFTTFRWTEHEKARSHLTIRSRHRASRIQHQASSFVA